MSNLTDNCLFCKIIRGEVPSVRIYEDDKVLVFLDIFPLAEGHTLIIPKYHGARLHDIPDEYLSHILPLAKKVGLAAGSQDYNILQNSGPSAVPQPELHIPHVHIHVVPKPNRDVGLILSGKQEKAEREELVKVAERIKSKM